MTARFISISFFLQPNAQLRGKARSALSRLSVLYGIAVLNGVVMVSEINQRLSGNADVSLAIFEGALSRLRPVLMKQPQLH